MPQGGAAGGTTPPGTVFAVRAFGPGLPVPGSDGELIVHSAELVVRVQGTTWRAPLRELALREAGFGGPGIELAWGKGEERRALQILDPARANALLAHPAILALPQYARLRRRQRRHGFGRGLGWTAVGVFLALPLLALVAFVLSADRLAGWVVGRLPTAVETKFGRASFDRMKPTLELRDSGPAFEAVSALGARLTAGSRYHYAFHVAKDATLNAYALPGGIVVVHTGLIAATKRPEELAGVLAHEVQHVELRHSTKSVVKELGLSALWAFVTGSYGDSLPARAAREMTGLKFSRDAETEADRQGFAALVKADIDPSGMPAFFATMEKTVGDAPAAFLSSHPLSGERKAALERERAAVGSRTFHALPGAAAWPPAP
ncbi:MAG: M48 family metallopeptidase [Gammaproteobacteria bacterium]|nr:M48 family metallopeptidase [Gammaproteobacteria bacterium]